ncbi:hypothetical protein [Xanthomonas arboricola]|nr:hypothetical protein [Xanthomonas arboricola]
MTEAIWIGGRAAVAARCVLIDACNQPQLLRRGRLHASAICRA